MYSENMWCNLFNCFCDDVEDIIDIDELEESYECCMDCECCFFLEEI